MLHTVAEIVEQPHPTAPVGFKFWLRASGHRDRSIIVRSADWPVGSVARIMREEEPTPIALRVNDRRGPRWRYADGRTANTITLHAGSGSGADWLVGDRLVVDDAPEIVPVVFSDPPRPEPEDSGADPGSAGSIPPPVCAQP